MAEEAIVNEPTDVPSGGGAGGVAGSVRLRLLGGLIALLAGGAALVVAILLVRSVL